MKLVLVVGCIFLLSLTACSSKLPPAYSCVEDSDCMIVRNSIKDNQCCMFDSLNKNYESWYQEKEGARLMCIKPCDLDISTVRPVCLENVCTFASALSE